MPSHHLADTHYAEGSLMPILVNKLIFGIVPSRTPFLLRPLVSGIFGKLTDMLCDKPLKVHTKLVRSLAKSCMVVYLSELLPLQIEDHLEKSKTMWFAGGEQPTSADFMMMFAMICLQAGNASSPKIDAYVKMLKERYASYSRLMRNALERY